MMEQNVGVALPAVQAKTGSLTRWIGAILLFVVSYVHLSLFFSMFAMNHFFGGLMLVNGVGALIALIGVLVNARWAGWILGVVMSGGAAVAKIAMNTIPGVGALLMGRPAGGMKRPPQGAMHGGPGGPGAHAGGGQMHQVLPLFASIQTWGTISIIIELVFVALAIYALVKHKKRVVR